MRVINARRHSSVLAEECPLDVAACRAMEIELDLASWSVIGPEAGGRDERKVWVAAEPTAPRSEHWLWKPRQRTDDGSVLATNDVSEVAASRLAQLVGLPAAECRFAVFAGEDGVVSKNVTPSGFDLHDGETFLHEVDGYVRRLPRLDADGRAKGYLRLDEGYTLEAVEQVLEGVGGPPGHEAPMSAFQVFAGYLAFDALIANTDRHPRNWALLERRRDGKRFLAPTFDHGTALGSGMSDEKRHSRDPVAFCARGRANAFTPRGQSLVNLAHAALRRSQASLWWERFSSLSDGQIRGVLDAPPGRLSEVASRFIEQVLIINRRRLCDVDDAEG
jgi:hypothetical protein